MKVLSVILLMAILCLFISGVSYALPVTITWCEGLQFTDGEPSGYKVTYKIGMFGRYKPAIDVGNVLSMDFDLPAGYYCWKVKAYNGIGESAYSDKICRELK